MSEPKLISPLLDNFIMGVPISDHNGVRCCPAINEESDDKYIVKVISVPASQTQLDALLLSGAYESKEAALSYYKALAEGIIDEAHTLDKLAKLEGFVPYEGCQLLPMENEETGFDIYLLGTYKRTLARYLKQHSMTHLAALNLALDICAALAVCRRAGYLYVDLKPDNIYILNEQDYRIGDLGFVKLDSLKYASMPDRYRSKYTAPEIADAFSALNTTMDVYALGLILYQVFNDGNLPFKEDIAPAEAFATPAYADYEMAEIILKACDPDPSMRWQDPVEMGQALVSYMQRNGAHDTPIVPTPVNEEQETEEVQDDAEASSDSQAPDSDCAQNTGDEHESDATFEDAADSQITADPINIEEASDEAVNSSEKSDDDSEEQPEAEVTEASIYTEDEDGNLTFLDDAEDDETAPDHSDSDIDYGEVSDEVSDILSQADALIAHPAPDPVIQPEPIEVPIPEPIMIESEDTGAEEESLSDENEDPKSNETVKTTETEEAPDGEDDKEAAPVRKRKNRWFIGVIIAVILLGLVAGGFYYYRNYYLQPIDSMLLEETAVGVLTVHVTSQLDESKLTVLCSDTYGNQLTSPVKDGKAVFSGLSPSSAYTVKVVANGFHRLTGDTSVAYTTPDVTSILHFRAVTGTEDGSVILGFTIDGPDSDQWKITYVDDSGAPAETVFSGHMVTISGLTVGNVYNFTLLPVDDIHVAGQTQVEHTASKIIKTSKVMITGCVDNTLSVAWAEVSEAQVESWTVRCYNDSGYEQSVTTSETTATFTITDAALSYTVEVTAEGMSVSERAYASANSLTVSNFQLESSDPNAFVMSWNSTSTPTDGWRLLYTVDGASANEITCKTENRVTISPVIPGSKYIFSLQAADGTPILGGERTYTAPDAANFSAYGVTSNDMEFYMCRTPENSGWDRYDLGRYDYITEFSVGERASFLIRMDGRYESSQDEVVTLFVIRDQEGTIVCTASSANVWNDMWDDNYFEVDISTLPQAAGTYSIAIYFNGAFASENDFTLVP